MTMFLSTSRIASPADVGENVVLGAITLPRSRGDSGGDRAIAAFDQLQCRFNRPVGFLAGDRSVIRVGYGIRTSPDVAMAWIRLRACVLRGVETERIPVEAAAFYPRRVVEPTTCIGRMRVTSDELACIVSEQPEPNSLRYDPFIIGYTRDATDVIWDYVPTGNDPAATDRFLISIAEDFTRVQLYVRMSLHLRVVVAETWGSFSAPAQTQRVGT